MFRFRNGRHDSGRVVGKPSTKAINLKDLAQCQCDH
jgi:hypothetical protein